ncbi:hypothetical protein NDU88_008234 [Pleurodeles waltl]|uniref:Uncharacterized protein n=1 Tax=Pleurodeles waltl TaxID=8319 RepID=A0AAV7PRI7_PLEWA|nr:hypothetical protein NDU88_008234 [Pleurodeles waltl]
MAAWLLRPAFTRQARAGAGSLRACVKRASRKNHFRFWKYASSIGPAALARNLKYLTSIRVSETPRQEANNCDLLTLCKRIMVFSFFLTLVVTRNNNIGPASKRIPPGSDSERACLKLQIRYHLDSRRSNLQVLLSQTEKRYDQQPFACGWCTMKQHAHIERRAQELVLLCGSRCVLL